MAAAGDRDDGIFKFRAPDGVSIEQMGAGAKAGFAEDGRVCLRAWTGSEFS